MLIQFLRKEIFSNITIEGKICNVFIFVVTVVFLLSENAFFFVILAFCYFNIEIHIENDN